MKKIFTILFCLVARLICFSQTYNCNGSLTPIYATFSTYSVDSFAKKTPVEIQFTSVYFHGREIKVHFHYKDEIEFESPLLPVTDSIAVKLILSKIQCYGEKRYMYSLIFCYKDGNCWIETGGGNDNMTVVISQKSELSGDSVGTPDTPYYIRVNEGWMKLN